MCKNDKIDPALIPGGLTSLLQPLDVFTNLPFKATIKEMDSSWMIGKHE
jgi:hypothetical protein